MAITQNPIIGRAKGKFGTAIFTTLFGQNILKTLPVSVRNPNTPAQQLVREKFVTAAAFIKLIYSWVKLALPSSAMNMSPFAAVLKEVVKAVSGEAGMTKVDAKKALDGFLKYKNVSWFSISTGADSLDHTFLGADAPFSVVENDIVDVLFCNDTTGDVTSSSFSVNSDLETSGAIAIPFTVATDDYACFLSIRKYAGSKAGSELAGAVS